MNFIYVSISDTTAIRPVLSAANTVTATQTVEVTAHTATTAKDVHRTSQTVPASCPSREAGPHPHSSTKGQGRRIQRLQCIHTGNSSMIVSPPKICPADNKSPASKPLVGSTQPNNKSLACKPLVGSTQPNNARKQTYSIPFLRKV